MNKPRLIILTALFAVLIFTVIISSICFGAINNNNAQYDLPYKMYIVNRYMPGGVIIVTSNIDINLKKLKLEYFADQKILQIKVGEIIGDMEDVNALDTFNLECNENAGRAKLKSAQLDFPKFKKGMTLVVWVDKVNSKYANIGPIGKKELFETLKNIELEHNRLTVINNYKNKNEVISEIERNQEE